MGTGSALRYGLLAALWTQRPDLPAPWQHAAAGIHPEALRAHVEFLADDALEGRGTGLRGHELAARYIRAQFQSLGLTGAVSGGFFQRVPLRKTEVVGAKTHFALVSNGERRELGFDVDYTLMDTHRATSGAVDGPMVLAGFGISAPELGYDDYAALDVRDKLAVFVSGAPSAFPSTRRAYYSDHDLKRQMAAAHGARGLIELRSPDTERRFPWPSLLRELRIGWNSMRWLDAKGEPHGLQDGLGPWIVLSPAGSAALLEGEALRPDALFAAAEAGKPRRGPLKRAAALRFEVRHSELDSPNVVGRLDGGDPRLKQEFVVYTAHADHIGIGPEQDGDAIYNGALDNAAGCAALLEVARAFAALEERPKRSALFVAVTGEEAGLLGSDYFARHLPIAREAIVANLNIDGGASFHPVEDVLAWGDEHSSLGKLARRAARETGFSLGSDPFPEETFFVRSDQYSFVKQGVPALFLELGFKSTDPGVDALAAMRQWLVTAYHSPKDDATQAFHYPTGARFARFAFRLGHLVSTEPEAPRWNPGDFFGERYGARR